MSVIVTIEDIKEDLKTKNLKLISKTYEGCYSYIEYEDEFGYKYKQTLASIKRRPQGDKKIESHKFSPKNIYALDNFKLYIKREVKNGTCLLSDMLGSAPYNVRFKCGRCSNEFNQNVSCFIDRNPYHVCPNCAREIQKTRLIDFKEIKKEIEKTNFELVEDKTTNYKNTKSKIVIKDKDGYLGAMPIATIIKSKTLSPFAKYNPYAIDNIKKYILDNNIESNIYEQPYPGWDFPIKFKCGCGKDFETTLTGFMAGKIQCNDCSKFTSNLEKLVENWLVGNNIKYESQKKFEKCKNIRCLPFDFYLKEHNILLEIDGEGHYMPVRFNGASIENANYSYNNTTRNDKIKNKFCEESCIKLIRIPYWEFNENNNYINILNNSILNLAN